VIRNAAGSEPPEAVTIEVGKGSVSGLFDNPPGARTLLVLAHGAGAGMRHAWLERFVGDLRACRIASLRYQFPFMEQGAKRPDPPPVAHAAVRAAVEVASSLADGLPLLAGGRSFGGRMTSQAQAAAPLRNVRGLVFLGFPLHPAGRPSSSRAEHLRDVHVPMLFMQGTRDALAELPLLQSLCSELGKGATLRLFDGADHSFHVLARSGRTDAQISAEMARTLAQWVEAHL
jgi:uncharacterized protein